LPVFHRVADLFANGWPIFLILGGRSFCAQAAAEEPLAAATALLSVDLVFDSVVLTLLGWTPGAGLT
jgi:hypothetical protein